MQKPEILLVHYILLDYASSLLIHSTSENALPHKEYAEDSRDDADTNRNAHHYHNDLPRWQLVGPGAWFHLSEKVELCELFLRHGRGTYNSTPKESPF